LPVRVIADSRAPFAIRTQRGLGAPRLGLATAVERRPQFWWRYNVAVADARTAWHRIFDALLEHRRGGVDQLVGGVDGEIQPLHFGKPELHIAAGQLAAHPERQPHADARLESRRAS